MNTKMGGMGYRTSGPVAEWNRWEGFVKACKRVWLALQGEKNGAVVSNNRRAGATD